VKWNHNHYTYNSGLALHLPLAASLLLLARLPKSGGGCCRVPPTTRATLGSYLRFVHPQQVVGEVEHLEAAVLAEQADEGAPTPKYTVAVEFPVIL